MGDDQGHGERPETRAATRTNLFMAATLLAGGGETPVKIRDLSASGAQIEGALVPVGTAVTLARGKLTAAASVAWCSERRCGLKFAAAVSVHDWMGNPTNREQRRVDQIVSAVKAGAAPPAAAAVPAAPAEGPDTIIASAARLIEILGDALASDPAVVVQHGIELQNLDIALQTLTTLIATLRDGDDASRQRLAELRTSCAEAIRRAG